MEFEGSHSWVLGNILAKVFHSNNLSPSEPIKSHGTLKKKKSVKLSDSVTLTGMGQVRLVNFRDFSGFLCPKWAGNVAGLA